MKRRKLVAAALDHGLRVEALGVAAYRYGAGMYVVIRRDLAGNTRRNRHWVDRTAKRAARRFVRLAYS